MKRNYLLAAGFAFFTLLTLFAWQVPFFWDVTYFAHQANEFYIHGYTFSPLSSDIDTGGFPLYASWMFCCWKLFGRTLLVSHLALLPFLLGVVYEYVRLAGKYLTRPVLPYALLLLCLEPALTTQSILMGYDVLLLYFFLAALNAMLEKRMVIFSGILVLLAFSSMRGIFAALSIALIHCLLVYRQGRLRPKLLIAYLPMILGVAGWAVVHKHYTGWYFFSPVREHAEEQVLGLRDMGRQFIFISWKLVDSGRVFLWLVLGAGVWSYFRRGKQSREFRFLLAFVVIPLIVFLALMVPLSNPSSARYFLIVYAGLCLAVCYVLQDLRPAARRGLALLLALGLLSGNCWIYPERFSNGWDTSLKVMPFFQLKKEMIAFIQKEQIPPEAIATQFPLIDNNNLCNLGGPDYQFTNALDGPLSKFHYYLHSNVCNTDLLPQIERIQPTWRLLKSVQQGQVYLKLYENPDWREE
jgi:hypothetical protein